MDRPNPDGWQGGSEDFTFTRTLDGRRSVNVETDPSLASDFNWRRNTRTPDEADLGGRDYGGA